MKKRIISIIIALIIVVPIYIIGGVFFDAGVGILAAIAFFETLGLKDSHKPYPTYIKLMGIICLMALVYGSAVGSGFSFFISAGLTCLSLAIPSIFTKNEEYTTKEALYLIGSLLLIGTFFNGMINIYHLDKNGLILLYLLLIATMTDTFAMLIGCLIGKHKLIPSVSPKKSVEGSVAGSIVGTAIASIYYYNVITDRPLNIIILVLLSLVLSILGQIGDLFFSKIKRENDIKDFSNLMPGHGGILDRLDSLSFIMFGYMVIITIINMFI